MAVSGKVTYNISWKEEDASSENLVEPNATNFEMCLTVPYLEGFGSSKNGRGPMIEDFSKYYVYIENDFRIHRRGSLGEELTNRATPDLVKSGHDMQLASVHISDQGHFQVNFTGFPSKQLLISPEVGSSLEFSADGVFQFRSDNSCQPELGPQHNTLWTSRSPRAGPACTVKRFSHSIRSVNYLFLGRFEFQGPSSPSPTGLENKPCYEYAVQGMDPKVAIGWTRIAGNSDCFFFKSNENLGEFVEDSNSLTCLGTGNSFCTGGVAIDDVTLDHDYSAVESGSADSIYACASALRTVLDVWAVSFNTVNQDCVGIKQSIPVEDRKLVQNAGWSTCFMKSRNTCPTLNGKFLPIPGAFFQGAFAESVIHS
ncbi:uncharacterized protein LOC142351688 [Convolutriloba macropyga]|uniref:uncharacterized protein LOC142351688 n=1 Tax=Convolutriloba macropyga TaxID=536237 RepID=UPI003F52330E